MRALGQASQGLSHRQRPTVGGHAYSLPLELHGKVQNLKISSTSLALASMDLESGVITEVRSRNPHLPRAGSFQGGKKRYLNPENTPTVSSAPGCPPFSLPEVLQGVRKRSHLEKFPGCPQKLKQV